MAASVFINPAGGSGSSPNPTFDSAIINGDLTVSGVVKVANGSEALPSIAFAADLTTGLFMPSGGKVSITAGASTRARADGDGFVITPTLGFSSGAGAADTTLSRTGSNALTTTATLDVGAMKSGGTPGVDFGPLHPASLTSKKGIVTAAS